VRVKRASRITRTLLVILVLGVLPGVSCWVFLGRQVAASHAVATREANRVLHDKDEAARLGVSDELVGRPFSLRDASLFGCDTLAEFRLEDGSYLKVVVHGGLCLGPFSLAFQESQFAIRGVQYHQRSQPPARGRSGHEPEGSQSVAAQAAPDHRNQEAVGPDVPVQRN
jgi:hypothetical protein